MNNKIVIFLLIFTLFGVNENNLCVSSYLLLETPSSKEKVNYTETHKKVSEWDVFISALIWVESKGNNHVVGKNNDGGILQIRPIYVKECNRIMGFEKYCLEDRFDSLKSIEMFNVIQSYYNPEKDIDIAIYYHNKSAPESYKRKIKERMEALSSSN